MACADEQPLTDLLQQVGTEAGWFDEKGDFSESLENLSLRVRHGSKKKTKEKIVRKGKTPKSTSKKPKQIIDMSKDDFESESVQSSKKLKPSAFPFTSSEESFFTKPQPSTSRKRSSEDSENQPPSMTKTRNGKNGKKKAVMKKLVSFSSDDELSTELDCIKPKVQSKSTPVSLKRVASTDKTPLGISKTHEYVPAAGTRHTSTVRGRENSASGSHTTPNSGKKAPMKKSSASEAEASGPKKEGLYPNLDELMKKTKPRISIGAKGYETIVHSPRHIRMSRLSTNSNISSIDLPIAESTALEFQVDPTDSYLARPVFQEVKPTASSKGSGQPCSSQDLALELTLTQPSSDAAAGSRSCSNSVPSSEFRGRSELTQVPADDSSDSEAGKTVISETISEQDIQSRCQPNTSGPQVIEESSLSSKPKDSSSSLFSTKTHGNNSSQHTFDKSTDQSLGSLNLSSYIKGKKKKSKKKALKHLLIDPDLSSDENKPVSKDKFKDLLEESKTILESIRSDESELPFPLTQNRRNHVPDSQVTQDFIPPSANVYDDVRVSETDSSLRVVQDSECNFVPESQSVEVIKDSQETVDTTRVECVADSEAASSPCISTQPTQDTVIRVPTQDESSVDNATTMVIKSKSKYIAGVDGVSQNLSQLVSTTKRKVKRNIPLELIDSLNDPEDLQATIELLSQKLETIMSSKKASSKKKCLKESEDLNVNNPDRSFTLKQQSFVCVPNSPHSPQRSYDELCIHTKENLVEEKNQENLFSLRSHPTSPDARCVADEAEDVVSPSQTEKSMCNISLQCSMPTSPLTDPDQEEDNSNDAMYRTAIGDDIQSVVEQYLTDDESFEKEVAKTPSPKQSFHLQNVLSVERVKTILSESKLRRRSTQIARPKSVLSLDSPESARSSNNVGRESDENELPDIPNIQRSSLVTSWRAAPDACPSPPGSPQSPRRTHRSTDSSGEDGMEGFFAKMRTPAPVKKPSRNLDDFIVDDDDFTSDEDEEEELFHVRTDNRRDKHKKLSIEEFSSDDDEEDNINPNFTSDDDDDVFMVDKKQNKARTSPLFKTPSLPPLRKKHASSVPRGHQGGRVTDDPATTPVRPPPRDLPNTIGHAPARHTTFLHSLGALMDGQARHPEAIKYVKDFHKHKAELSTRLFHLYNTTIFESKLPESLEIKWNGRLLTTAGFCAYKRKNATEANRRVRIELSVKVCDSPERVRDTLIHEMCHAIVWIVHGVDDGHGPYWKHWAQKANRIHPDLPVIKRCHSYSIQTKYIYKCTQCGYEVGRHSKSLNTDSKVCGYCRSPFQLLVNSKRGKRVATPSTPRTPNRFALFVKENYKTLKEQNQVANHKEVMALLSAEFAKTKVSSGE